MANEFVEALFEDSNDVVDFFKVDAWIVGSEINFDELIDTGVDSLFNSKLEVLPFLFLVFNIRAVDEIEFGSGALIEFRVELFFGRESEFLEWETPVFDRVAQVFFNREASLMFEGEDFIFLESAMATFFILAFNFLLESLATGASGTLTSSFIDLILQLNISSMSCVIWILV